MTRTESQMYQIKINLLRIQTFLFSVPRLRNMVGANVLFGETIRCELAKCAVKSGCSMPMGVNLLPPKSLPIDPLTGACEHNEDLDDPLTLFKRGILSRDGGHFTAIFDSETNALKFKKQAELLLNKRLPGLKYEIFKDRVKDLENGANTTPIPSVTEESICLLPQFQICQESGKGPATKYRREDNSVIYMSEITNQQREAGRRFYDDKRITRDLVGLLRSQLYQPGLEYPENFEQLAANDYLAVILADGNDIGKASKQWRDRYQGTTQDSVIRYLEKEAYGERFFHYLRVLVRTAVVEALKKTFSEYEGDHYPYQVMMLGGDDLLLACRAEYAFSFLVQYTKELKDLKKEQVISEYSELKDYPITIGAGVAIASPKFPFYRLHAIAESLASSAKRYYRDMLSNGKRSGSVVDWSLITQSWSDDPITERKRDSFVQYAFPGNAAAESLALTCRPYKILGETHNDEIDSLEGLVTLAKNLEGTEQDDRKAARSQLKRIVNELRNGKVSAELAFKEMASETRQELEKNGFEGPWEKVDESRFKTRFADLLEVWEILKLSKRKG